MTTLLALLLCAAPTAGTYIQQGGGGTLVLGKGRFSIDSVGANAHLCSISGTWSGATGLANDEGETCKVTFEAKGDEVIVGSDGGPECRSYCGARAYFETSYFTPAKGCAPKEVTATRKRFKALYDKKDFGTAVTTLKPLLACENVVDRFDLMWIRNDLSLALHKAGDDAACLAMLEPLAEYRDASPDEPVGYEPAYEELLAKIAKATRTNAKLCGFKPSAADAGK